MNVIDLTESELEILSQADAIRAKQQKIITKQRKIAKVDKQRRSQQEKVAQKMAQELEAHRDAEIKAAFDEKRVEHDAQIAEFDAKIKEQRDLYHQYMSKCYENVRAIEKAKQECETSFYDSCNHKAGPEMYAYYCYETRCIYCKKLLTSEFSY